MDTLAFPFEIKALDDAGAIAGIAAGIGNVDHGRDRFAPGAFAKSLSERAGAPIPMLLHHDFKRPVGVWTDLRETSAGLEAAGTILTKTRDGADAHELVKGGALRGLSVGFQTIRKTFAGDVRELHEVKLHEVSLVPAGMNDRARVLSVKSVANIGDLRDLLQEAGFSTREAKTMAGAAWRAIDKQSDDATAHAEMAALFTTSAARLANL